MSHLIQTEADQRIQECLDRNLSFSMVAGAGSGKTTSLVSSLRYLRLNFGDTLRRDGKQILCITYTNRAVDVISDRLDRDELFCVSTLHKFLWNEVRRFTPDICAALQEQVIPEIIERKQREDNGGNSIRAVAARRRIEALNADLAMLTDVNHFSYSDTNFSNYAEGLLSHDDVITVAACLILQSDTLRQILGQKYPYIMVDEAQDTFSNVVDALNKICEEEGLPIVGYFGDPMQQIYDKRAGDFSGPTGAEVITKTENFRCSVGVINLLNAFRKDVEQYAAGKNKAVEGSVSITLVQAEPPEGNRRRYTSEQTERASSRFNQIMENWGWNERQDVKSLFLARQMIAKRLGFPALQSLFTGIYASNRAKDQYEAGEHYLIKPFVSGLYKLVLAQRAGDLRRVIDVLRTSSPPFDPKGVNANCTLREMMERAQDVTNGLLAIWENGSLREILAFTRENDLSRLSDRLLEHLDRGTRQEDYDSKLYESEKGDWLADKFFEMSSKEIEAFYEYTSELTSLSTQHGVKGEEYKNVVVVFDDVEAAWNNYSFTKTLTPETSGQPTEGQIERSQKLAYVCFSRAEENLRILLFTPNPTRAQEELIAQKLFKAEQVVIAD